MSDETSAVIETPVHTGSSSEIPVIEIAQGEEAAPILETAKVEEPPKERVASKLSKVKAREAEANRIKLESVAKLQEAEKKLEILKTLKSNPSKALAEIGISFNDLASALLAEGEAPKEPSEVEKLKASLEALQTDLRTKEEKVATDRQEAEDKMLAEAVGNIKKTIDSYVDESGEKYDLVKATGNNDLIYEIMELDYRNQEEAFHKGSKKPPQIMHYIEACDLAEDYLFKKAQELVKSTKIKNLFIPPKVKTSFGKTLTSQLSQVTAAKTNGLDVSKMSHEERVKHAAKMLRFN